MFFRKLTLASIAVFGLIAGSAIAQTTTATPATRTSSFPLIGMGSTETAQISVINVATASSSGTAASCTGTIAFLNSAGTTIGTATPFTLAGGLISSAKLPFSSSGSTGVHGVVRGLVTLTVASGVPCQLDSLLEVYDTTTGVTRTSTSDIAIGQVGPGR